MSAPVARTASGARPFTVAWVPIGKNAGGATAPCGVAISPRRATPSVASRRNEKASGIGAGELRSFFVGCTGTGSADRDHCAAALSKLPTPCQASSNVQRPRSNWRGPRGAAANVYIDGYNAGDPADDRVAAGENTAVHRAVS